MQPGIRVLDQPFASHAHNGGGTGINLEAARVSALALHATERFHGNVTNLARGAIHTPPKLSVENYSAAHTGPEGQANYRLTTFGRPLPHLAESCGVGIIFQQHGTIESALQGRSEFEALQRV